MSLSLYKKKRNFSDTPEPEGKEKSSKDLLRFVIQKHDASQLHYDFRLEMNGVLKSWAVPKGPSLNPENKRLAMMVEDHPYDYRDFEGIIPAGNYGGGTVIVWDEGTYEPMESEGLTKKEQEKLLLKQLAAGDVKLQMHGEKIKGSFALFQLKKAEGGNAWLLVKKKDDYSSEIDITTNDKSVKSGKTIAQVAHENGTEPNHPQEGKKTVGKKTTRAVSSKKSAIKSPAKKSSVKKKPLI